MLPALAKLSLPAYGEMIADWLVVRGHKSDRIKVVWLMKEWVEEQLEALAPTRRTNVPSMIMSLIYIPFTLLQMPIWQEMH